jgi:hypothetical protein
MHPILNREGFPAPFPAVGKGCDLKPCCIYSRFLALCASLTPPTSVGLWLARQWCMVESAALAKTSLTSVAHAPKRVCDGRVFDPLRTRVLYNEFNTGERVKEVAGDLGACRSSGFPPHPDTPIGGTLRPRNVPRLRLHGDERAAGTGRCSFLAHPVPAAGSAHTGLYGFWETKLDAL